MPLRIIRSRPRVKGGEKHAKRLCLRVEAVIRLEMLRATRR